MTQETNHITGDAKSETSRLAPWYIYRWLNLTPVKSVDVDYEKVSVTYRDGSVTALEVSQLHGPPKAYSGFFAHWITIGYTDLSNRSNQELILEGFSHGDAKQLVEKVTAGFELVQAKQLTAYRREYSQWVKDNWSYYEKAYNAWTAMLSSPAYTTHSEYLKWSEKYQRMHLPDISLMNEEEGITHDVFEKVNVLREALSEGQKCIEKVNEAFVDRQLKGYKDHFDSFEAHPLTMQQRMAVVRDEDNNLVIAGAGTGKTSTIVAKVDYILREKLAKPEEILLLAFTRKAAEEMQERIMKKLGVEVKVRTFHSFGLEIIGSATGKKPSLAKGVEDRRDNDRFIANIIEGLALDDSDFCRQIQHFIAFHRDEYKDSFKFKKSEEAIQHNMKSDLRTLKGEKVKSQEELMIANWLTLHGINYEYEKPYHIDTRSKKRRQYYPDFYLPDYGVYLEHFGINRNGQTAPYIDQQAYTESMAWKRNLHKQHGSTLLESYSWQIRENGVESTLTKLIQEHGITLSPLTPQQFVDLLKKSQEYIKHPFIKLVSGFLALFKGGLYLLHDLMEKVKQLGVSKRVSRFLELFSKIYDKYQALLAERNEIDFNDMIGLSISAIKKNQYRSRFKYLMIDEYQDISGGRAALIKHLRNQVPGSKLFTVGDDWQSIYRFTGADLSLMTQFEEFFGYTRRTPLDQTFRFNNQISKFSQHFILKNPLQIEKDLKSHRNANEPKVTVVFPHESYSSLHRALIEISSQVKEKSFVFILNRYGFHFPEYAVQRSLKNQFPRLDISFLTCHASKGLEADYVIIDNIGSGEYGFPTGISDDPLYNLVLSEPDRFGHAEERRLFYVALTRARNSVYLIQSKGALSPFIAEILKDKSYKKQLIGKESESIVNCPVCKSGILTRRDGPNKPFSGCSNYPHCTYKEELCPECQGPLVRSENGKVTCAQCSYETKTCPRCKTGILVKKSGKYGSFYGCSMYNHEISPCDYTVSNLGIF